MPSGNVTLTANFQASTNLLPVRTAVAPIEGGTISPAPNAAGYPAGAQVSLTAVPAAGYVVDYWYGGACRDFSGATCTFTMPATPVDAFVRFRKTGGTGYTISTAEGFVGGVSGNPHAAGMVAISPFQDRIAAGTPVTLTVYAASGYRFSTMRLAVNGTPVSNLCPEILNYFFLPGRPAPTCTFPMPAGNLSVETLFDLFPPHYALDISVAPQTGGVVTPNTVPNNNLQWYRDGAVPSRLMVEAGVATTLTATPAGARQFVKWLSGPCAASTNPVCTFNMPAAATQANAEFSNEPASSCTYSVQRPAGYVPATGGERSFVVTTQPGCNYNATFRSASSLQLATMARTAAGITLNFQPNTTVFPQEGVLRIHTGREVFNFSLAQAGSANGPTSVLPPLNLGPVDPGEFGASNQAFTITNPTSRTLTLAKPVTNGPFAVASSDCGASLAPGASCQLQLGFTPTKAGTFTGELMLLADSFAWIAPNLTFTSPPNRENVAAAAAGGWVMASNRHSQVEYHENAVINGDRRGEIIDDQGNWYVVPAGGTEALELRFAKPRQVSRLNLFGRKGNTPLGTEPFPGNTASPPGIAGFKVDYWTGTTWAPVTEVSKVSGSAHRVQRLDFTAVTTDRLRVTIDSAPNLPTMVAEAEVWTVPLDATVDAFSFASVNPAVPNSQNTSNAVTPTGFNVPVAVSVSNGRYSIGCTSTFTTAPGALQPGESVCVRNAAPGPSGGSTVTTLTVGDRSASYATIVPAPLAAPADITPFEAPPQVLAGVRPGSEVQFTPITVSGINAPANVTVANGAFSLGCSGTYTDAAATVTNGAAICVAHTSAATLGATVTTTLTVGTVPTTFTSVTASAVDPGDVAQTVTQSLTVAQGWNLLGNGVAQSIPVAELGSAAQIESVWRWNATTSKWAFYSPELSAADLAAYAQKYGFEVLERIEPNQGFWLKAKSAVQLHSVTARPLALAAGDLPAGWHLMSSGTGQTPVQLATVGAEVSTRSVWAWEPVQKKWFFYAPDLAAKGGTALSDYIAANGFLDFAQAGRKLELGTGLWVNRSAAPVPSFSLTMNQASLAAVGAVSNNKHEFITGRNNGTAIRFFGFANPGNVRIPNRPEMQFTSEATFDIWARIDSAVGMDGYGVTNVPGFGMALLAKSHDRAGVALTSFAPNAERGYGHAALSTYDPTWSNSDCAWTNYSPKVGLGEWHRVTAVASSLSGTRVYLNKTLVAHCPTAKPDFSAINREDLFLGTYSDGFWYPMQGALQDLRIYQRALTTAEVEALQ